MNNSNKFVGDKSLTTRLSGEIKKAWGSELIFATNDKYCGKFLKFNAGAKFSMHFHSVKDETWHVIEGKFLLETIDTSNAKITEKVLQVGDTQHIPPLFPHRLTCIEKGCIIEVSTADSVEDNFRVLPGDNQK